MTYLVYTFVNTVGFFLFLLQILMLGRILLAWIMPDSEGRLVDFVFLITDIIVVPIKALFDKLKLFQNSFMDMSFIAAVVLLMVVQLMLPVVRLP